jgi:phospholipase C
MALRDIDTIVIVILENRSFDHTLGYLSLPSPDGSMPVEGLRADAGWMAARTNYDGQTPYPIHRLTAATQTIEDPPHEQATIAIQINTLTPGGNKMGGFVKSYLERNPPPADPSLVMGYYDKASVPVFDFFARNFTVCDHWFAALPTGTQANRLMAMSGQSTIVDNAPVFLSDQDLVYDWLTDHQVSWCAYQWGDFLPFFTLMPGWLPEITTSLALPDFAGRGRFRRCSNFYKHWTTPGTMPSVIFIEPEYTDGPNSEPNDDHPPTGIARGQNLLADVYGTLISNEDRWHKTLMIVTYDEHGGFFDHVAPLPIPTNVSGFKFETTGVRVPGFVISPHIQPGQVFPGNLDHTSILQLLADRFNPGKDYSAAVGARQPHLARLADLVPDVVPTIPAIKPIPQAAFDLLNSVMAAVPIVAAGSRAPGAAATARAFESAAQKAADDHPELVSGTEWKKFGQRVAAGKQSG